MLRLTSNCPVNVAIEDTRRASTTDLWHIVAARGASNLYTSAAGHAGMHAIVRSATFWQVIETCPPFADTCMCAASMWHAQRLVGVIVARSFTERQASRNASLRRHFCVRHKFIMFVARSFMERQANRNASRRRPVCATNGSIM